MPGLWCWSEIDWSNNSFCHWRTWCWSNHWTDGKPLSGFQLNAWSM